MDKVRFEWSTKDNEILRKMKERFNIHRTLEGNVFWVKVDVKELELLKECEKRGFIQIRGIE